MDPHVHNLDTRWRSVSREHSKCEMTCVTIHIIYLRRLIFLYTILLYFLYHVRAKITVARTLVMRDDRA
jgi:hypothetical protein